MKIILPSSGKTGILSVSMRQPKISDLRKAPELTEASPIRKNEVLEMLLDNPDVLSKITVYDRDYLFLIAVAVVSLNVISYKYKCGCGEERRDSVHLGSLEPIFLTEKEKLTYTFILGGIKYTTKILTAKEEESAVEYALKDEDSYEVRLEDAKVCLSLGRLISTQNIEWVRNQDVLLYGIVDFFHKSRFHGTKIEKVSTCTCGKITRVITPIEGGMLTSDTGALMERFVDVSDKIDYISYLDLTIPEYNTMIKSLEGHEV